MVNRLPVASSQLPVARRQSLVASIEVHFSKLSSRPSVTPQDCHPDRGRRGGRVEGPAFRRSARQIILRPEIPLRNPQPHTAFRTKSVVGGAPNLLPHCHRPPS